MTTVTLLSDITYAETDYFIHDTAVNVGSFTYSGSGEKADRYKSLSPLFD
jgi:hypothetical protein